MAMLVTHISAAAGSLVWVSCEWIRYGKPSVLGIVTGMIADLGAITPASGFVGPLGSLVLGSLAGLTCYFVTQYVKRTLQIDNSLDVFSVHGIGGILGTLLTAVFTASSMGGLGLETGSIGSQFAVQLLGVVTTILWCGTVSFILFKILDMTIGLRVNEIEETEGLDFASHGERGYIL